MTTVVKQRRISAVMPDEVQRKTKEVMHNFLIASRHWKLGSKAPKVKGLRRKLAMFRPKPVPDTGVIYERTNPNGSKRHYKVQPNGEWRRVKD